MKWIFSQKDKQKHFWLALVCNWILSIILYLAFLWMFDVSIVAVSFPIAFLSGCIALITWELAHKTGFSWLDIGAGFLGLISGSFLAGGTLFIIFKITF